MVLDYSDRRPVTKNRPRKQPVGIYVVILISAVFMSFGLGVLTGWLIQRPVLRAAQNQLARCVGEKGSPEAAAPQATQKNPEAGTARGGDPPLTFYETLPKGGKSIIGSGLNPKKRDESPNLKFSAPYPALPRQLTGEQPVKSAVAVKPGDRKEQGKVTEETAKNAATGEPVAAQKQSETAGKFCVQIASSKERKEAETMKARLAGKGLPVYILESTIKGRGTWFRVRVGRHLSQQAAGELAGKAGKGAMVIPE